MKISIKEKEKRFLNYLSDCIVGQAIPSERDIALNLGLSRGALREFLAYYGRNGVLMRQHGKPTLYVRDALWGEEHF